MAGVRSTRVRRGIARSDLVVGQFDGDSLGGLENGTGREHIRRMENVHKCTSVLRPLIAEAKTNGIPLAENAINELVAVTPAPLQRDALESVRSVVKAHRDAAGSSSSQCDFADTVNDYIEKLVRSLV
ncbi:hypothetical protein CP49_01615 [Bradyrhizobium valentinum]|uniref:Uncharacterized protein n=1 Tax=Bradyrhizobium valentinum TaxID=1518501 RepID=A0A0R3LLY3_9BRAD|nr:hypothetical protein CP49_01615 [Bradyrhizobium valentinum]